MNIYTECSICQYENKYKTNCSTRVQFVMKEGEFKMIECKKCGNLDNIFVDKFYTKRSKLAKKIAVLLFLTGISLTIYLTYRTLQLSDSSGLVFIFGVCFFIPSIAFIIINKQDKIRVRSFNSLKLRSEHS